MEEQRLDKFKPRAPPLKCPGFVIKSLRFAVTQTSNQENVKPTNKPTNKQASQWNLKQKRNKPIQTVEQTSKHINKEANKQTNKPVNCEYMRKLAN